MYDSDVIAYDLCEKFRCLPSQLKKENSKIIEKFITIMSERNLRNSEEAERQENEMKMKMRSMT